VDSRLTYIHDQKVKEKNTINTKTIMMLDKVIYKSLLKEIFVLLYLRQASYRRVLKTNKQFSEARNKQATQRGAEQTSNSARRGAYKQFAVPLDKQATAFSTKVQLLLPK